MRKAMIMKHRIRRALGVGWVVGVVLLAGLASGCEPAGGTVEVTGFDSFLTFTAAPGQTNQVTVNPSGDALLVTDAGDEVNPGNGCTRVDAHTARCSVFSGADLRLLLGDGNDQGTNNTSHFAEIDGGTGSDTLNGGSGFDVLIGQEGADTLNGNGGDDQLKEGTTASAVDSLDRDTFNGGAGVDTINYRNGTVAVGVDLDGVADDGRPRERDNVGADVEDIDGTSGDDHLTGDADDNQIIGDDGNDTLVGGAGFDRLIGGSGTDTCDTGPNGGSVDLCES
jgi:Ca2+-binding RTX toxin-like protein